MTLELVITAAIGLLQGLVLWILKDIKRSERDLAKDITELKVSMAEISGQKKAEMDLVFREINSEKQKIVKMEGRVDALWKTIERMAEKVGIVTRRTSDDIKR